MLVADLDVRILDSKGALLRHLTLDPSKDCRTMRGTTLRWFIRPRNSETSHGWR
jgi:hypothetical protein